MSEVCGVGEFDSVLRVIMLGDGAQAAPFAGHPNIECLPVPEPHLALAELALRRSVSGPVLLLVSAEAVEPRDIPTFLACARRLRPGVRIIAVGPLAGEGFNVRLDAFPTADRLHELARDEPIAPSADARRAGTATETADAIAGESALLRALLTGGDVLGVAIARLRSELGSPDITFRLAGAPPFVDVSSTIVEVRHHSRLLGTLTAPRRFQSQLEPWATWFSLCIALADQQNALRAAALTDALTGVWNRRYLDRFLRATLRRAARSHQEVAVLYVDVVGFTAYNLSAGRDAADDALRLLARALSRVTNPADRVCRVGPDEFVLVLVPPEPLPDMRIPSRPSIDLARETVEAFRAAWCDATRGGPSEVLRLASGAACFPWDGDDASTLIAFARRQAGR